MVGRMPRGAEAEEGLAERKRVAVKQELLLRLHIRRLPGREVHGIARLSAQQGVLTLLAIPDVIGVRPIGVGRGRIVLLDAALHFGKQRFLQAFGVCKRALAIIVFGLQIGAYRRIELKRIAHHFAPVLRLEPSILIDEAEVVESALKGTLLRPWLGGRARGHWGRNLWMHHHKIISSLGSRPVDWRTLTSNIVIERFKSERPSSLSVEKVFIVSKPGLLHHAMLLGVCLLWDHSVNHLYRIRGFGHPEVDNNATL